MLSLIDAFRACRNPKQKRDGSNYATIPSKNLRPAVGRFVLIVGLACLPLGNGCRSGSPSDWVGERVAMSNAWQEQSSQSRGEDASFQEGWRSGFHDGRSQASQSSQEREPAQFEAFTNSKREEANSNWRRGYDSGFVAAENSDNRHHAHAELFIGSTDLPDTSASQTVTQDSTRVDQQTRSQFSIPRNGSVTTNPQDSLGANENAIAPPTLPSTPTLPTRPTALPTLPTLPTLPMLPTISAAEGASISASTSEIDSQAPSSFNNAAAVLDSVIKRNAAPVTTVEESATIAAALGLSQPTAPEAPESESESGSDANPDESRSIMDLPLADDDMADTSASQNGRPNISTLESAAIATPPTMTVEAVSSTMAASHLKFGQIPHAYQGRMQLGHIVTNPHVSSAQPAPPSPKILDHPPTDARHPLSQNTIAPNQVATFVETSRSASSTKVPIANDAPDSPSIQVMHEVKSAIPSPPSASNHMPKGLPLQKRK